ncbi:MAG TPA: methylmalonyl Co-A mutase-associated GTPase MeaB [Chitinophagaceae bacterium]|nr:methylmalonyl Co-A mutase-associated GTPase MeaB [Chitinophagaceae bacterium]
MATRDPISQNIDYKTLARTISLIENESPGYEDILRQLKFSETKVIGITGAPGAGKSSLADALIGEMVQHGLKAGVLCVDPSSPFNRGALLGDRIRMSAWYNNPNVFIRSLASKGSLGGLPPKIVEITEIMKNAGFDYIIIETVGVGQSETDIASLADITVLVLVPEGGDIIQTMKAGVMEIADVFVVNKYDRPDADAYYHNLKQMLAPVYAQSHKEIPVLKTIALQKEGVKELYTILTGAEFNDNSERKTELLTEKIWQIIRDKKMRSVNKQALKDDLAKELSDKSFNLYRFAEKYV